MNAAEIIQRLKLQPHPEGGFYKETYRCEQKTSTPEGERNVSTAIYYLLENEDRSHFHRIKSDELWFFHQGQPLEIIAILNDTIHTILLGNDLEKGEVPQAIIPANCWFASHVKDENGFALVSCTVAPGFDFLDFEMAKRADLMRQYPDWKEIIKKFTRQDKD